MFLHVMTTNAAARKFYVRHGFRVAAHIPSFYPVTPGHAFLLYNPLMGLDEAGLASAADAEATAAKAAAQALMSPMQGAEGQEVLLHATPRGLSADHSDFPGWQAGAASAGERGGGQATARACEPVMQAEAMLPGSGAAGVGAAAEVAAVALGQQRQHQQQDSNTFPGAGQRCTASAEGATPSTTAADGTTSGGLRRTGISVQPSELEATASPSSMFSFQADFPRAGLFASPSAKEQGVRRLRAYDEGRSGAGVAASAPGAATSIGNNSSSSSSNNGGSRLSNVTNGSSGASTSVQPFIASAMQNGAAAAGLPAGLPAGGRAVMSLMATAGSALLQALLLLPAPGAKARDGQGAAMVELGGETLQVVRDADGEVTLLTVEQEAQADDLGSGDSGGAADLGDVPARCPTALAATDAACAPGSVLEVAGGGGVEQLQGQRQESTLFQSSTVTLERGQEAGAAMAPPASVEAAYSLQYSGSLQYSSCHVGPSLAALEPGLGSGWAALQLRQVGNVGHRPSCVTGAVHSARSSHAAGPLLPASAVGGARSRSAVSALQVAGSVQQHKQLRLAPRVFGPRPQCSVSQRRVGSGHLRGA